MDITITFPPTTVVGIRIQLLSAYCDFLICFWSLLNLEVSAFPLQFIEDNGIILRKIPVSILKNSTIVLRNFAYHGLCGLCQHLRFCALESALLNDLNIFISFRKLLTIFFYVFSILSVFHDVDFSPTIPSCRRFVCWRSMWEIEIISGKVIWIFLQLISFVSERQ